MFVSSYAVLFVLIGLRLADGPAKWVAYLAAGYGLIVALFAVLVTPRAVVADPPKQVVAVEDRGNEVAGYLVAYILPFLMAPTPSGGELAQYGLFLAVVGVIYARSSLLYINPIFYLMLRRVTAVKFDASDRHWTVVLTTRDLRIGDKLSVRRLSARLGVEARVPKER